MFELPTAAAVSGMPVRPSADAAASPGIRYNSPSPDVSTLLLTVHAGYDAARWRRPDEAVITSRSRTRCVGTAVEVAAQPRRAMSTPGPTFPGTGWRAGRGADFLA
ncbi:hypothetical protein GCM10012287_08250 [Streptomyces daqingensis]|uniref:Uncharacterized protein n=1 Tax=Streptomyces daqingensis TaxID=1472640 RepID=A0ABQ2LWB2_9ACTN|nr:hypothetical protein GCM10012287_08250 [Streptomyces daqingensis]